MRRLGARTRCRRATSRRSCCRRSSSKAQILGLANAGGDTINSIKAANEFGITKTMKLAGLLVFINDIHSLGLKTTQGMYLTDSWYWNRDAETRAWGRKFFDKIKRMPSSLQAADYSATLQYLNAVKATGTDDADKVLAQMKKTKINDIYTKGGWIRADGRMIHDMYLMQVKSPDKSTEPWDYYNVVADVQGRGGVDDQGREQVRRSGSKQTSRTHREAEPGMTEIFGIPIQAFLGPADARAGQRLVLRDAEPRPGRHLRPARTSSTSRTARSTCWARSSPGSCWTSSASTTGSRWCSRRSSSACSASSSSALLLSACTSSTRSTACC